MKQRKINIAISVTLGSLYVALLADSMINAPADAPKLGKLNIEIEQECILPLP